MAKTEEDLRASREARQRVIDDLGCVSESILQHDKSDRAMDLMIEEQGRAYKPYEVDDASKHLSKAFEMSSMSVRNGGLSRFPQNIGRIFLKLYSKPGDTYVDPFAGHNSRMEFCFRCARNYIGSDISAKFMDANRTIRERLLAEKSVDMFPAQFGDTIDLHECDSRKMPIADKVGEITITSPPYWDIEFYGEETEQLGYKKTYLQFIRGMAAITRENFRVLKPGAFTVWCINDFRKDGRFYSYHEDMADCLRDAGFYQWDIAITDLGSSFGQCFAQQVVERKILPKRHEYCLIYRKPE